MKYGLFTISTFDLIPICRHITAFWCNDDGNTIEMAQCSVANTMTYHKRVKEFSIGQFSSREEINKQSFAFKVLKYIRFIYYLFRFQFKYRSSVLYAIDLSTLNLIFLSRILFFYNKNKIIYHQFEIVNPDNLSIFGKLNLMLFKLQRKNLDLFISPEANRLDYFCRISGYSIDNTLMFPNTTTTAKFNGIVQYPDDVITIAHVGIAGENHYIGQLMEIIKEVIPERKFRILFIGYLPDKVKKMIESSGISNFEIIGDIPHKELQEYYKEIDIGLILYKDIDLNYKYCAPNKLYEYWSNGILVIAHKLIGLVPLFDEKTLGLLCDMERKEEFKEVLLSTINNFSRQNRANLIEVFKSKYSIENYLSEFSGRIAG